MIDSSLQILVKQSLQLFILLIQEPCLLDEVLSLHQEGVVLGECFIKGSPDTQALVGEDFGHSLPEHLFLALLALLFLLFSLEVRLLLEGGVADQVLVVQLLFTFEVELLENFNNVIEVNIWLERVLFFLLIVFEGWDFGLRSLLLVLVSRLLFVVLGCWVGTRVGLLVLLGSLSLSFLSFESLLFLWAKLIKGINKKCHIVHRLNTE